MLKRSLIASGLFYLAAAASGIVFIASPSAVVSDAFGFAPLTAVWGIFFVLGGLLGLGALYLRPHLKNVIATWLFEAAGLALCAAATGVYAVALISEHKTPVGVALAILLIGIFAKLVAEAIGMWKYTQTLIDIVNRTNFSHPLN